MTNLELHKIVVKREQNLDCVFILDRSIIILISPASVLDQAGGGGGTWPMFGYRGAVEGLKS